MKTDTISVFLMMMILWAINCSTACICKPWRSQPVETLSARLRTPGLTLALESSVTSDWQDTCKDCGHSRNCCAGHEQTPMLNSMFDGFQLSDYLKASCNFPAVQDLYPISIIAISSCGGERAAPYTVQLTPAALNQVLLN